MPDEGDVADVQLLYDTFGMSLPRNYTGRIRMWREFGSSDRRDLRRSRFLPPLSADLNAKGHLGASYVGRRAARAP
jgi:hypothetical protein